MSGEPQTVEAIAAKAGAHAPSLYRVMRMLASFGVFKEGPQRHFALTPVGDLLKTGAPGSLRYMAMMFGEEFSTRAYEHIADCLRSGGDGVTEAYGKPIWEVLAERPEQCETFQRAMTNSTSVAADAIVEAYDFSGIQRLADVGGGHGAAARRDLARQSASCRACCSIARRWSRMCRNSNSPAAMDA